MELCLYTQIQVIMNLSVESDLANCFGFALLRFVVG